MPPKFKQRCVLCKKNMVIMYSGRQFPICEECQMKRIQDEVTDPKFAFLNLSDELYRKSRFLRSVKEHYLRTSYLSEKQIATFKKAVREMKKVKKEPMKKISKA